MIRIPVIRTILCTIETRIALKTAFMMLHTQYLYTVGFSRQSATRCQGTLYAASLLDTTYDMQ